MNENEEAKQYMRLVDYYTKSWGNPMLWADLYSAGCLGLLNAIRTWAEDRGTKETYYSRCIRFAQIDYMRKEKIRFEMEGQYLEDMKKEDEEVFGWQDVIDSGVPNPEQLLIMKEDREYSLEVLFNVVGALNEREQYILEHRVLDSEPETLREIATHFDCSYESIRRDEERILNKLNNYYIKEETKD